MFPVLVGSIPVAIPVAGVFSPVGSGLPTPVMSPATGICQLLSSGDRNQGYWVCRRWLQVVSHRSKRNSGILISSAIEEVRSAVSSSTGLMGVGLDLQQPFHSSDPTRSDSDRHMWVDLPVFPVCSDLLFHRRCWSFCQKGLDRGSSWAVCHLCHNAQAHPYPAQICFFWMGHYEFSACFSLVCLKVGTNRLSIDFLTRKQCTRLQVLV